MPMRYRIRPAFSKEEIPSRYNLFNARSDSLLTPSKFLSSHSKKEFFEILNINKREDELL
ncbi:MAG: hypothetical protein HQK49_06565 [Oligoflexia bacterium]|nr:hypothetical protein [Oligoflexia bacterium]